MGPVEVAVLVDALRLHPEAEAHAQLVDLGAEALEAVGQLLPVHSVVPETPLVVVPALEPAVVQDEQLSARLLRPLGQGEELPLPKGKKTGFPIVAEHRPFLSLPVAPDHVAVDEVVEVGRQAVEAPVRIGHDPLRCLEGCAGGQGVPKAPGADPRHDPDEAVLRLLHGGVMVAAVEEVEAPATPLLLVAVGFGKEYARIVLVAGGAGAALVHVDAGHNGPIVAPGLPYPAAVEGGEGELSGRHQVQHVAHKLVDYHGGLSPVLQHRPAGDHVLMGIDRVDQVQRHGGLLLLQMEDQGLGVVTVGRWQAFHGQGAALPLVGFIDEIVGESAVGEGQLRRRVPKIALAHAAPFEGQIVEAVGVAALVV